MIWGLYRHVLYLLKLWYLPCIWGPYDYKNDRTLKKIGRSAINTIIEVVVMQHLRKLTSSICKILH